MGDCIEYDGFRTKKGYGRINRRVNGRIVSRYAHRIAWETAHGPIPEGMVVMHACDNPPCVNVEHLHLGTQADNIADMNAKGRGKSGPPDRTHCRRGHEFTTESSGTRNGYRYCRTCNADRERMRRGLGLSH